MTPLDVLQAPRPAPVGVNGLDASARAAAEGAGQGGEREAGVRGGDQAGEKARGTGVSRQMGRTYGMLVVAALVLTSGGCKSGERAYRAVAGPEAGRHRITIAGLAVSESDFSNSALGGPKDIEIRALKDGAEIFKTKLAGYRGPKAVGTTFEIDYDPQSRYEFKIDEVEVVSTGHHWSWSSTEPGNWIFGRARKNFGSGSSIEFRDEKVQ